MSKSKYMEWSEYGIENARSRMVRLANELEHESIVAAQHKHPIHSRRMRNLANRMWREYRRLGKIGQLGDADLGEAQALAAEAAEHGVTGEPKARGWGMLVIAAALGFVVGSATR